jgi:hypothetical protein
VAPPGWLTSAVLHCVLLIVLSLVIPEPWHKLVPAGISAAFVPVDAVEFVDEDLPRQAVRIESSAAAQATADVPRNSPEPELIEGKDEAAALAVATVGLESARLSDALAIANRPTRGGLAGRTPEGRSRLVGEASGTGASELAVERGLRWLAAHQEYDGAWRFDHRGGPCRGMCRDHGSAATTTGATAVALLAFLGAGYTHEGGEYERVVRDGIYYLKGRMLDTPRGGDLQEGTMYAQGLATIALAEAYAMTGDKDLGLVAQSALDFVLYAQDRSGGGWRYSPGQPGDLTVTGWQFMAVKSGEMAYLIVPAQSVIDANRFLDQVQSRDGALYGYQTPGDGQATTAIGLLCRMYGGWQRDRPALKAGVAQLLKWGPSRDDIYYNYYATQVLRHFGGDEWERWNMAHRDPLIAMQATQGHESGSWYLPGVHCQPGGRLLSTALAVMTLEVYYRYLPLYQADAWDEEFGGQ